MAQQIIDLTADLAATQKELQRVTEEKAWIKKRASNLLREYGSHEIGCDVNTSDVCTCGFRQALSELEGK